MRRMKMMKLMRILMIVPRMFCPLHTPAEKHACDFDYQVDHEQYLNWHCGTYMMRFPKSRPRQETRLRRRTQRCGGHNLSSFSHRHKLTWLDYKLTQITSMQCNVTRWWPRKWWSCERPFGTWTVFAASTSFCNIRQCWLWFLYLILSIYLQ